MSPGVVHLLVPGGVDDPGRASGGNHYDRHLGDALRDRGWTVRTVEVEGGWPWCPGTGALALHHALAALPDDAVVLADGLVVCGLPEVVVPASSRLRVVVLVHLPAGVGDPGASAGERAALVAARAVVTTSAWSRDWVLAHHDLRPDRVLVARPGVREAPVSPGSADGRALLAIGPLGPVKGQDRLLAALAEVADEPWRCRVVGSTSHDEAFATALRGSVRDRGLQDRVQLLGVLTGAALDAAWHGSDLLVVASRVETYGMVVTEALARGVPVVATDVGGVAEALDAGAGADRADGRPGLLLAPDTGALAAGLRCWLSDPDRRARLRAAALRSRPRLPGWSATAALVGAALDEVAR